MACRVQVGGEGLVVVVVVVVRLVAGCWLGSKQAFSFLGAVATTARHRGLRGGGGGWNANGDEERARGRNGESVRREAFERSFVRSLVHLFIYLSALLVLIKK